ncbi:hypothetical protein [Mycobacterium leprae]|uniref:hypothetical protein n=1 Tax=Mycobacterium leprae TaxID=1769 RepID=UPI0006743A02|nr:hypothetical protein [Mycobacterium leprae]
MLANVVTGSPGGPTRLIWSSATASLQDDKAALWPGAGPDQFDSKAVVHPLRTINRGSSGAGKDSL